MNTKKTKRNTSATKAKVFVGLSGGVDSAVSAALLLQEGYDVTGVFIKVWSPDFLPCTWREERRDAMRVAAHLDIPFIFLDLEKEYKEGVADYMIREYKMGRTPNPDVMCNRIVKFGAFWNKAKSLGADFIATGHYAQIHQGEGLAIVGDNFKNYNLAEGHDNKKDQSYFLWTLTPDDLSHTLFPVGEYEKSSVRNLAKKFNLPVAEKKDSQGICFIGEVSLEDFLSEFITTDKGDVLNTKGEVIGLHNGALYYTIGERRGFEVTLKGSDESAFYVVSKNMDNNTITVSSDKAEITSLSPTSKILSNVNFIHTQDISNVTARIRYRGKKIPIILNENNNLWHVQFEEPILGLSAGQSIVFYRGEICLGGAVIE